MNIWIGVGVLVLIAAYTLALALCKAARQADDALERFAQQRTDPFDVTWNWPQRGCR